MSDKVDFDKYIENYDELLSEGTRFFTSNENYFASYKANIASNKIAFEPYRILEFGCGTGRNIGPICSAFPKSQVEGSDIAEQSLVYAKKQNPSVTFFLEDGKKQERKKYDLIFVAGVFHHIALNERLEILKGLLDRLTKNGEVFIFEHNPFNPITQKIVSNCPYDADAVLIKPKELKNLLKNAGFKVQNHEYCLFFPPKLSFLKAFENKLGWLPLGGQYWVSAKKED